jgi:hypothetical protein
VLVVRHCAPVVWVFSTSGFHRSFATKPVSSETCKAERRSVGDQPGKWNDFQVAGQPSVHRFRLVTPSLESGWYTLAEKRGLTYVAKSQPEVVVRAATLDDSSVCGQICFDAFSTLSTKHGFPCDFPGPQASTGLLSMLFSSPGFYCVVAERGGRMVGSNCLDERSLIAGIGPITVDPGTQKPRRRAQAYASGDGPSSGASSAGMRLVQAAYHNRSLSLYTTLGFDVREPLSCVQGRPLDQNVPGCVVRPAQPRDLEDCNALSRRVRGFDRGTELVDGIHQKTASVVERAGCITGYATALAFFGHATAQSNLDMQALIASTESFGGPGILVPSRNSALLRWCLQNGLQVT